METSIQMTKSIFVLCSLNTLSSTEVNYLLEDNYEQPNGERNPFILKSLISDKLSYPFGHIALGDEWIYIYIYIYIYISLLIKLYI